VKRRTDGMRCIVIPGAEVEIGNPVDGALSDQLPVHQPPG